MNDLISRQDAMELARDVCDAIMSGCDSYYDTETGDEVYKDILEVDAILKCNKEIRIALKNMPSAEPEIIRCRNCKHSHLTYDGKNKYCVHWPNNVFSPTEYLDGGFFCGFAKRREE